MTLPGVVSSAVTGRLIRCYGRTTGNQGWERWCLELEARRHGIAHGMVIAIDKAQEAGIKYNRQ